MNPFEIPPATVAQPFPEAPSPVAPTGPDAVSVNPAAPVVSAASVAAPADTTSTAVASSAAVSATDAPARSYYVIGGCFRSLQNAEKYVAELKAKNVEATIIGKNKAGFYMVSLFSSASYNQTTDALPEIKTNVVESAWVYKK